MVVVPIEGRPRVYLHVDTHEDEVRLRGWLRRSAVFRRLPAQIVQALDDLDRRDRGDEAA